MFSTNILYAHTEHYGIQPHTHQYTMSDAAWMKKSILFTVQWMTAICTNNTNLIRFFLSFFSTNKQPNKRFFYHFNRISIGILSNNFFFLYTSSLLWWFFLVLFLYFHIKLLIIRIKVAKNKELRLNTDPIIS